MSSQRQQKVIVQHPVLKGLGGRCDLQNILRPSGSIRIGPVASEFALHIGQRHKELHIQPKTQGNSISLVSYSYAVSLTCSNRMIYGTA